MQKGGHFLMSSENISFLMKKVDMYSASSIFRPPINRPLN